MPTPAKPWIPCLRGEEVLRLDGARLAVVAFGDVENHRVRVQLWRERGCVVLKLGADKPARGLRRMIAADAGLRIVFELVENNVDALPVRLADALIATDKSGE